MSISLISILLAALLLGSVPTGYLLGRACGVDLRKEGSGNIGATNARRVLGRKLGAITLVCDILKGVLATQLPAAEISYHQSMPAVCGLLAVVGHCFSPFLNFKGGKGVATALGVFSVLAPRAAFAALVLFYGIYKATGFVSAGSIGAALLVPLAIWFGPLIGGSPSQPATTVCSALIGAIVILRHKENIRRLFDGSELRANQKN